jgi:FkbM family methyltransferase
MMTLPSIGRSVKSHYRTIYRDILAEPLNEGRRVEFLRNYFTWHALHKHVGRKWEIRFENNLRSLVYPYPDHDAGEINIWTRNVDYHDHVLIRRVLRSGDFIVDCGCNVGNRTLALADVVSGALLIDANPIATERAREHLRLNHLSERDFVVVCKAVGAEPGTARFTKLGGASTNNRIVGGPEAPQTETVEVEVTTIDNELAALGRTAAFIKIDVEGQDLNVLRGAQKTLRSGEVRLVKFERSVDRPLSEFKALFGELDWTVFALTKDGRPSNEAALMDSNLNLFAMPREAYAVIV